MAAKTKLENVSSPTASRDFLMCFVCPFKRDLSVSDRTHRVSVTREYLMRAIVLDVAPNPTWFSYRIDPEGRSSKLKVFMVWI
ncbi:MAG: hypothetical protein WDO73_32520 [Ignavibacteriota bacterium]